MTVSKQFSYRELSFTEFAQQYQTSMPKARLFELTLPWLIATEQFMLPENSQVLVHCLYQTSKGQEPVLSIAWPLVHSTIHNKSKWSQPQISSLSSFYSAVTEPIFFTTADKQTLQQLLSYIKHDHQWHSMQLGAFEEGIVSQALLEYFPYQRVFAKADNIYQQGLTDYASYYQQRPSQLRNTIKRRQKKLTKAQQYRIEIITDVSTFSSAFSAYKAIYQQSWKGDEFSFDFIEQVCLAALQENKLRFGLLFVDDEPAAAQLWFVQTSYNDSGQVQATASIFKLAYAPKYQMYSVGSILSLALSEHVISQDKVTSIEFGMGSEPYKQDWLAGKRTRQSYLIFNQHSIYGKLAIIRHLLLPWLIKPFKRKSK
ncbi:GNAT family N-acetyltransferase [Colwellia sp. TT2012]|uniref:GNAT family N-acetyltransferase n=1 Tax=Colwellia sp. TT2012 TaxID=1720342 RepID=UPI000B15B0B7|nr:GNAT family N-acetyltransferase [Colwellia sp. TT2012]